MSKIDTLIADLCPDGVEYRHLCDVTHFDRGQVITAKDTVDGGIPVVAGGQKPAYYHNVSNRPAGTITVAGSGAYAGYVSMWDTQIWLSDAFSVAPNDERELSSAFLYQLLKLNQNWIYAKKKGSGVPHVHGADLPRLQIPVPPIEVQREIVRILDSFAELEAELEARKAQYAYYRDRLLSRGSLEAMDGKPVEMVRLGDVLNYAQPTKYLVSNAEYSDEFVTPVLTAGKTFILGYTSETDGIYPASKKNPVIIFDDFTTDFKWVDFPFKAKSSGMKMLTAKDGASASIRYAYHAMKLISFVPLDHKRHWIREYSKFETPFPSLATQQKVVDILDRFDALTTSLTDGLPAEIEARRQQYEYYRDRLLDFPRKEVAAS